MFKNILEQLEKLPSRILETRVTKYLEKSKTRLIVLHSLGRSRLPVRLWKSHLQTFSSVPISKPDFFSTSEFTKINLRGFSAPSVALLSKKWAFSIFPCLRRGQVSLPQDVKPYFNVTARVFAAAQNRNSKVSGVAGQKKETFWSGSAGRERKPVCGI